MAQAQTHPRRHAFCSPPTWCATVPPPRLIFYKKAFNAQELARIPGPGGKLMHAMLQIGDSRLMLNDEFRDFGGFGPHYLKGSPVTIHLYVTDVDAQVAQAVAAGAKLTMPVADMFWGDRYGQLEDPFGHKWSVATHLNGHHAGGSPGGDDGHEAIGPRRQQAVNSRARRRRLGERSFWPAQSKLPDR